MKNRIQNSLPENRLTQFGVDCNNFLMDAADFYGNFYMLFLRIDLGATIQINSRLIYKGRGLVQGPAKVLRPEAGFLQ